MAVRKRGWTPGPRITPSPTVIRSEPLRGRLFGQTAVGVVERLTEGRDVLCVLLIDLEAVFLLDRERDLHERQGVQAELLEGRREIVRYVLCREADALYQ